MAYLNIALAGSFIQRIAFLMVVALERCVGGLPEAGFLTNLVYSLDLTKNQRGRSSVKAYMQKTVTGRQPTVLLAGHGRTSMNSLSSALEMLNLTAMPGMLDVDMLPSKEEMIALYGEQSLEPAGFIEAMTLHYYQFGGRLNSVAAKFGLKIIFPRPHDTADRWAESLDIALAQNFDGLMPLSNLLLFDVQHDGWAPLCEFVGVESSACPLMEPFPYLESRAEFMHVIYVFTILPWMWLTIPLLPLLLCRMVIKWCCVHLTKSNRVVEEVVKKNA